MRSVIDFSLIWDGTLDRLVHRKLIPSVTCICCTAESVLSSTTPHTSSCDHAQRGLNQWPFGYWSNTYDHWVMCDIFINKTIEKKISTHTVSLYTFIKSLLVRQKKNLNNQLCKQKLLIQGIWRDSAWLGCLRTKSSLGISPNILAIGWNLPDYKRIPWSIPGLWKLTKKVETGKKKFAQFLWWLL